MHKEQARLFLSKVIVKGRHINVRAAQCVKDRVDLALQEHEIAGGHSLASPDGLKVESNGQPHRRRHAHARVRNGLGPGDAKLVYAAVGLPRPANQLVEQGRVKIQRSLGCTRAGWHERGLRKG